MHPRIDARSERGSVSLFVSVAAVALIAVVGLVFDGRAKVSAMQRADAAAAEAARAAGQHIAGEDLDGGTSINRSAALAAAYGYLDAAGVDGTVRIIGDTITVTTHTSGQTVFLSIVGITTFDATGEATVQIQTGL